MRVINNYEWALLTLLFKAKSIGFLIKTVNKLKNILSAYIARVIAIKGAWKYNLDNVLLIFVEAKRPYL